MSPIYKLPVTSSHIYKLHISTKPDISRLDYSIAKPPITAPTVTNPKGNLNLLQRIYLKLKTIFGSSSKKATPMSGEQIPKTPNSSGFSTLNWADPTNIVYKDSPTYQNPQGDLIHFLDGANGGELPSLLQSPQNLRNLPLSRANTNLPY